MEKYYFILEKFLIVSSVNTGGIRTALVRGGVPAFFLLDKHIDDKDEDDNVNVNDRKKV